MANCQRNIIGQILIEIIFDFVHISIYDEKTYTHSLDNPSAIVDLICPVDSQQIALHWEQKETIPLNPCSTI